MINSGTLTFAAECLTDSDSEAEVVPSEVASANKRTFKALLKTCFLSKDHQRQQVLKNCQEASEDSETGSSAEQSQPLKIVLLIKWLKILKTEVLMNVSSIQDLKILKTKCQRILKTRSSVERLQNPRT